jgi:hypothetical protein
MVRGEIVLVAIELSLDPEIGVDSDGQHGAD